ncbi:MAG: hypothetical protein QOF48_2002 [Verrucomicrobiota bacterium]|jgi:prepilin-type N-terminal cleavage/methylation domain-containing protein
MKILRSLPPGVGGPRLVRRTSRRAFTLIEILVVIGIVALLAGLVVYLLPGITEKRVRGRVTAELEALKTIIGQYKEKTGFYPPDNSNNVALPPLFYELKAVEPLGPQERIELNIGGIANAGGEGSTKTDFFPSLKPSGTNSITTNGAVLWMLVVPYKGPGGDINPWHYNSSNPQHNIDGYDLWAEVVIGDKTIVIGNWKE